MVTNLNSSQSQWSNKYKQKPKDSEDMKKGNPAYPEEDAERRHLEIIQKLGTKNTEDGEPLSM